MEIHKLKYFYMVAKYQHVTRASEEIHIAQPSLTQAIHSLEDELGVQLFLKRGRSIILTEYGKYLKKRLDTLLPEIEGLPTELQHLKDKEKMTVRLNILAGSSLVINAIMEYRKKHQDVIFDFEQSEHKSNADILVATDGVAKEYSKDYSREVVKTEKLFLAVPDNKKYRNKTSITLDEVKNERFVMLSNSRLYGKICNRFCAMAGFSPKILFESDSPTAVQNIISTGTGIAFWPEFSWGNLEKNSSVKLIEIEKPDCKRNLIFQLFENGDENKVAKDFFEYLVNI